MEYVHLDFETRSICDLKKAGAWRYAEDPTTEIMCLSYWMEGWRDVLRWFPGDDTRHLTMLAAENTFVAFNAGFEQAIWSRIMVPRYGFPEIPVERWQCTQAACAWRSLPLSLDKAAKALNLPIEKDTEGNKLTLSMSRYDKKGNLPELTADKLNRIMDYCDQDVVVEERVKRRLGSVSLSPNERGIWALDQTINQRGVRIDTAFVRAAMQVVERATKPLQSELAALTGGLRSGQRDKLIEWCQGQGVEIEDMQKGTIAALLGTEEEDSDPTFGYESLAEPDDGTEGVVGSQRLLVTLPHVRRVLQIRQMLGSASIKKLERMLAVVSDDGRARGLMQYHAAGTGRWGGRLLQPHNFPRGDDELRKRASPEHCVDAIMTGDPEYVEAALGLPAIEAVVSSLRFALIPNPGKTFLVGDFAGIEMRIVLALAEQYDKCDLLATGKDIYLDMAEDIYNRPRGSLTKDNVAERTIGKNTVLGCGFGMGPTKFRERYCPEQSVEFAEGVVDTYRTQWAPLVPQLWSGLANALSRIVYHGEGYSDAFGCKFLRHGDRREPEWMTIDLPSGWQRLWYHWPAMRPRPRGLDDPPDYVQPLNYSSISYKGGRRQINYLYGGKLTENAVQALARGLLCRSVQAVEQANMPVVLTVHDEIVCEVDEATADLKAFEGLMAERSDWAKNLRIPVAVEAWQGNRYRK